MPTHPAGEDNHLDGIPLSGLVTAINPVAAANLPLVILAAQVKKGDQTWEIRDENGKPLWTGRQTARK